MMKEHQLIQISTGHFQQVECPLDIGFDERIRRNNRSIDVGFRRKMTYGVNGISVKGMPDSVRITDIRFDENITLGECPGDIGQVLGITGIGQLVQIDDAPVKIWISWCSFIM